MKWPQIWGLFLALVLVINQLSAPTRGKFYDKNQTVYESDAQALWDTHYHTIRNINIRDYTQEQVEAWPPDRFDLAIW